MNAHPIPAAEASVPLVRVAEPVLSSWFVSSVAGDKPGSDSVMTENIENLILEHLRALRGDVAQVKDRLSTVELRLSSLESQVASLHGDFAIVHARIDRVEHRLDRIETRLGLISA